MAYLHQGDFKPTNIFSYYPCSTDSVYIIGLEEGETILSVDPFFQQNADGYLAIDDRFSTLYIQKDGVTTQRFDVRWNTGCNVEVIKDKPIVQEISQPFTSHPLMIVMGAGILTILVARMVFHEKN